MDDAIHEIRDSLIRASETAKKDGRGAVLLLDGAELEVKFTTSRSAGVGGKAKASFWVVEAGIDGSGEVSRELVHTLRLKFVPARSPKPAVAETKDGSDERQKVLPSLYYNPELGGTGHTFLRDSDSIVGSGGLLGLMEKQEKQDE